MTNTVKINFLLLLSAAIIVALFFVDPIPQDLAYHQFVDGNTLFGIPNFYNVLSNIGFIIAGGWGLIAAVKNGFAEMPTGLNRIGWIFILGIFITGFGSSYYHLNPNNTTLVWDRLPMTLAFMAFFTLIIAERISVDIGQKIFGPLLVIGLFSVIYWQYTENRGMGDLRLYVLVQFLPILLIPLMLLLFPATHQRNHFYWWAIVFYLLAKVAEFFDREIYEVLRVVSGHSLKHVLASVGGALIIVRLITYPSNKLTTQK